MVWDFESCSSKRMEVLYRLMYLFFYFFDKILRMKMELREYLYCRIE
jgi:hypothetical protein